MQQIIIDIESILFEIYNERYLKDLPTSDIEINLNESLSRWSKLMIILSNSERYDDVDKISNEIIELKKYLEDVFPKVYFIVVPFFSFFFINFNLFRNMYRLLEMYLKHVIIL